MSERLVPSAATNQWLDVSPRLASGWVVHFTRRLLAFWSGVWALIRVCGGEAVPTAEFTEGFERIRTTKGTTEDRVRFRSLVDLWWRYQMASNPEFATYVGFTGFNDRWADVSREAVQRQKEELKRTAAALATIDRAALPASEQLYFDLFQRIILLAEEGGRYPEELLAVSQLSGPQQELAQSLTQMPTATRADYDRILARLKGLGPRLDGVVELLREGLQKGVTPPQITLRDVPRQVLDNIPENPRHSPLFRPFVNLPSSWSEEERAALQGSALAAITNVAYPGFRRFHRFLVDHYLPGARTNIAATQLPDGEAWYAYRVRSHTTTRLTPQEIHQLGLAEVKRIRREMEAVITEAGFKGSFQEFLKFLRTDPQFYYARGTELLAGYRDISKRIDLELPRLFGRLPRLPYGVKPIPSYIERAQTTAYYQPGAATQGRPGVFFANTYALDMRPKWEMEALTLHEAVPGHHLQMALAQEIEGMPEFQKHAEIGAFLEGWALYSESLGPELGLYTDPYSKFGQLTYEMWRAIRLVVDTGMHALGWSRQQAIDFFLENSGKTAHDIEVEVDRYIVWPGQALGYKIGELKIKELRAYAQQQLGQEFDVRAFHDEVLSQGALPLDILEPRIRAWVDRQVR